MRLRSILSVVLLVLAMLVLAQPTSSQTPNASFAGTWNAEMNGLPGVMLTVANDGGKVRGTIVFYLQTRKNVNTSWQVTGKYEAVILVPRAEGNTLTFEVQHHTCDGCTEFGPDVHFRVELTGADEARIWRLEDGKDSPGYKLVRTK